MASDFRLKEILPDLTDKIIQTYTELNTIHHLGHCPLPRYERVIFAIESLREILFPGYQKREGLHIGNITYHVGDLIDMLHDLLTEQISRALRHEDRTQQGWEKDCVDYEAKGQALAIDFLGRIPHLRRILATDVQAAYDGDPACKNLDEVILCYPGLEAITVYRLAHEMNILGIPFIPRMMTEYAHHRTGIDIHPGATIDEYFFIDHGTGVVLGETCHIGKHVKIYQGVTLGALSFDTDSDGNLVRGTKRHPTVEDSVVIYANATVLGGNTVVGRNSVIGSSVWLTKSVPPNTVVTLEKPNLRIREAVS